MMEVQLVKRRNIWELLLRKRPIRPTVESLPPLSLLPIEVWRMIVLLVATRDPLSTQLRLAGVCHLFRQLVFQHISANDDLYKLEIGVKRTYDEISWITIDSQSVNHRLSSVYIGRMGQRPPYRMRRLEPASPHDCRLRLPNTQKHKEKKVRALMKMAQPAHLAFTFTSDNPELLKKVSKGVCATARLTPTRALTIRVFELPKADTYSAPQDLLREFGASLSHLSVDIGIQPGPSQFPLLRLFGMCADKSDIRQRTFIWFREFLDSFACCPHLQALKINTWFAIKPFSWLRSPCGSGGSPFVHWRLTRQLRRLPHLRALALSVEPEQFLKLLDSLNVPIERTCCMDGEVAFTRQLGHTVQMGGYERVRGNIRRLCCVNDRYLRKLAALGRVIDALPKCRWFGFCQQLGLDPLEKLTKEQVDELCYFVLVCLSEDEDQRESNVLMLTVERAVVTDEVPDFLRYSFANPTKMTVYFEVRSNRWCNFDDGFDGDFLI